MPGSAFQARHQVHTHDPALAVDLLDHVSYRRQQELAPLVPDDVDVVAASSQDVDDFTQAPTRLIHYVETDYLVPEVGVAGQLDRIFNRHLDQGAAEPFGRTPIVKA